MGRRITVDISPECFSEVDKMVAEYGVCGRNSLIEMLMEAHADGRLLVLDAATKALLAGAAEEKMLTKARRAARETTYLVLFEEGYRAHPYED